METLNQIRKTIKPVNLSYQFRVEQKLLKLSGNNDAHAQFQIGLQALSERRFGFAIAFFNLIRGQAPKPVPDTVKPAL